MEKRPVSILVVSIVLILFGGIALLGVLAWYALKDSPEMQAATGRIQVVALDFIVGALGSLLIIACGVGFLFRQGWMRFLLLAWIAGVFLYGSFRGHMTLLVFARDVVIYGVIFYFLFTPRARAWFAGKTAAAQG